MAVFSFKSIQKFAVLIGLSLSFLSEFALALPPEIIHQNCDAVISETHSLTAAQQTELTKALKKGYADFIKAWQSIGPTADVEASRLLLNHIHSTQKKIMVDEYIPDPLSSYERFGYKRKTIVERLKTMIGKEEETASTEENPETIELPIADAQQQAQVALGLVLKHSKISLSLGLTGEKSAQDLPGILKLKHIFADSSNILWQWRDIFGTRQKPAGYDGIKSLAEELVGGTDFGKPFIGLISKVRREEVAKKLLTLAFSNIEIEKLADPNYVPTFNFNSVMAKSLGVSSQNFEKLTANSTGTRASDFAELITELSTEGLILNTEGLFRTVDFTEESFANSELSKWIQFITYIRDAALLVKKSPDQLILAVFPRYFLNTSKKYDLDTALKLVSDIRSIHIKTLFGKSLELNDKEFEDIKAKWQNIEPLLTLAARMTAYPAVMRSLALILKAELHGSFDEFKFKGLSDTDKRKAQKQLLYLTPQQINSWRTVRAVAEVIDKGANIAELAAQSMKQLKNTLVTNLTPHLETAFLRKNQKLDWKDTNAQTQEIYESVINSKESSKKTFTKLTQEKGLTTSQIYGALLSILMTADQDLLISPGIFKALEFMLINRSKVLEDKDIGQIGVDLNSLMNDVRDLKTFSKASANEDPAKDKYIVITTVVKDAKSLLMIGDMVDATSCQSYRCGSVAYTLPAYVMDANIIATLSFALGRGHFSSDDDFVRASELISNNAKVIYDGNSNTFTISHPTLGSMVTEKVGKAFRRHIIRLGFTSKEVPSLRVERAYSQSHIVSTEMKEQVHIIAESLIKDLKTDQDSVAHFSESRNGNGVYSDLKGGIEESTYQIPPQSLSDIKAL